MGNKSEDIQLNQSIVDDEDSIDLLDLLFFFLTKIKVILLIVIITAGCTGAYTKFLIHPTYTSYTKIYMVSASSGSVVDLTDLNIGTTLSDDYTVLLEVRPIYESTIEQLDLPYTYEELKDMVTIETIGDSRVIKLSVTTTDKQEAKDIANTLAEVSIDYLPEIMETSAPHVAEKAVVAKEKTGPSVIKNTLIAAAVALVAVLGFYTVIYLLDDTLKTSEDVEKEFGVLPLTAIPETHIKGMHLTRGERKDLTFKDRVKMVIKRVARK